MAISLKTLQSSLSRLLSYLETPYNPFGLLLMGLSIVFLIMFGILGVFRHAHFASDFLILVEAGRFFLEAGNPWLARENTAPFAYPPHALPIFLVYGSLPEQVALVLHTAVNLGSIFAIAHLGLRWMNAWQSSPPLSFTQCAALAVLVGNPFMAHSVFEGQLALPLAVCIFWCFHFGHQQRWILAGLLLGCASIKPQLSVFVVMWFLLAREFRLLAVAAVLVLVLASPALIRYGFMGSVQFWLDAIGHYSTEPVNQPGSVHVVGLESLAVALGVDGTAMFWRTAGILGLIAIFLQREKIDPLMAAHGLMVLSFTFLFAHDTGYASLMLLWSLLTFMALKRADLGSILTLALMFGVFMFPQRFLRDIDWPLLHHTRTLVLPVAFAVAWVWFSRYRRANTGNT